MSANSPLVIFSFNSDDLGNTESLAANLGYPDAQIIVGTVHEAVSALNARTSAPDYLIIDIDNRSFDVFSDLDELALHCDEKVKVVVIGEVNDIRFYRELRARGVAEYCAKPVSVSDIRAALLSNSTASSAQQKSGDSTKNGTVISCISAASGDGSSTVAINLAYCLAEEFGQPTILIDMDYQFGLIAKSLDLTAPFGIRELFDYPERGVDALLVEKMQVKYGKNLRIIASPHELRQLPMMRPEPIRDLISILRQNFRFVIIDVPHVWTGWTAATLSYSDQVVMVGQLWLRSLTHAARLFAAWQAIGISQKSISLVINRSGAKFKEAISSQDFERICQHKIEAHIGNDVKAVVNAETHGKTIFEAEQDTVIKQQIRQFAQEVIVRSGDGVAGENNTVPRPTGKTNLLTFLSKKS